MAHILTYLIVFITLIGFVSAEEFPEDELDFFIELDGTNEPSPTISNGGTGGSVNPLLSSSTNDELVGAESFERIISDMDKNTNALSEAQKKIISLEGRVATFQLEMTTLKNRIDKLGGENQNEAIVETPSSPFPSSIIIYLSAGIITLFIICFLIYFISKRKIPPSLDQESKTRILTYINTCKQYST